MNAFESHIAGADRAAAARLTGTTSPYTADDDRPRPREQPCTVRRPEVSVLGSRSVVPRDKVARPPPNRFTHTLDADQPSWYDHHRPEGPPDGILPIGTALVLLVEADPYCGVVAPSGLHVAVHRARLQVLPHPPQPPPPGAGASWDDDA
ncbi:hypothetical protein [Kitasatospora sp. DSM 101779]|uniref:hypothetical protein n=1 Tax=Kitasatospora sp. DSM 101779 TaxID=2853165 RepID=UPI0021D98155|nr:hypothetical protein [Kitasatospora sp. DSM 101779]MCU7826874.1 hypothetical protein [Kitasatospora sp. DSM 101779]